MRPVQGWETLKASNGQALPPGGYECIIKNAETQLAPSGKGEILILSLDIHTGEYAGHFSDMFRQKRQSDAGAKWSCQLRTFSHTNEGQPNGMLKALISNIENSNPGYAWNWNESELRGKLVGMLFREKEFMRNNGSVGTWTEPAFSRTIGEIRAGKFKLPDKRTLEAQQGYSSNAPAANSYGTFTEVEDYDLPF